MINRPYTDPANLPASMMLTEDDVDRLLRDDSADSRSHILEKVAAQYNAKALTASEQEIAEHIFRLLMRDLSLQVRETLAEHIKSNDEVPRDVVLHLAHDVETVATPVLQASKVLSDADLVSIVEASQELGKLIAISRREQVSSRVSEALVDTHYTPVVTTLLENKGAEILPRDLTKIATEFGSDPGVMQAMVKYPNLPVTVVERILRKASDAVATELKQKYNLTDSQVGAGTAKVREEYMMRLLEGELPHHEIENLVAQMMAENSLSPSILMTALCRGQLAFFIAAMAGIARVPIGNASRLLADQGPLGFNAIYRKSELPESMREAIRLILRAVFELEGNEAAPGSMLYANRLVERVLAWAGERPVENLPYFIALIRQNIRR